MVLLWNIRIICIYEVTSSWNKETGGKVNTGEYLVDFDTPTEFDGEGKAPCPDHLFLASIIGCLMNTFLSFKKRFNTETQDLKIFAEMNIHNLMQEGYKIDEIKVKLRIVASKDQVLLNRKCAELARDYCHITRSIQESIPICFEIELVKV
jgi:organic hydroperoxide reductase OsmC/OhrA